MQNLFDSASGTVSSGALLGTSHACSLTCCSISLRQDGCTATRPTKGDVYFARLDGLGSILFPGEIKTPGSIGVRNGVLALSAPDSNSLVVRNQEDKLGWQLDDAHRQPSGILRSATNSEMGVAGITEKESQ